MKVFCNYYEIGSATDGKGKKIVPKKNQSQAIVFSKLNKK